MASRLTAFAFRQFFYRTLSPQPATALLERQTSNSLSNKISSSSNDQLRIKASPNFSGLGNQSDDEMN